MKIAHKLTIISIVLLLFSMLIPTDALSSPIKVVVIDAGHGGRDPGAIGKANVQEKDVNLKIALKLGKLIEDNYKDIKVVYTRKTDVFVELKRRTQIANENHADLFISIHCNSASNKNSKGSETFVMSPANNEANLAVAQKENASILLESNYKENYEGFEPTSTDAYIIFDLWRNSFLNQSIKFASMIQSQFANSVKLVDRGVKQAGFLVLWRTTMPSVLIEAGFLSNSEEEKFLASDRGQNEISKAIFQAFTQLVKEQNGINITPLITISDDVSTSKENVDETKPAVSNIEKGIVYRVQISCIADNKKTNDPVFRGLDKVKMWTSGKYYCYTSGEETTYKKALTLLESVKTKGFPDAFIVVYKNGEKLSTNEAKKYFK